MRYCFLFILLLTNVCLQAQYIYGKVYTLTGDLLPYSSVTVKGTSKGVIANNHGAFTLRLAPGKYIVGCHYIGYQYMEKTIEVSADEPIELNFILPLQSYSMDEVKVSTSAEDPAYAIMRKAVQQKGRYYKQLQSFECDLYSKNVFRLNHLPDKILGAKVEKKDMSVLTDSAGGNIAYLSETIGKLSFQQPNNFKLHITQTRVSGSNGLGFAIPSVINFYTNNVAVFSQKLNPRGFISPLHDNAFHYYVFRFIGSFYENGVEVNSIMVIPKRKYEPLFTGTINIIEGSWQIHSLRLRLDQYAQLELLDKLTVDQHYIVNEDSLRLLRMQNVSFAVNKMGVDVSGNFVNVFSDYTVSKQFAKKFFSGTVLRYDTAAANTSNALWDSIRPMPLESDEAYDYKIKDSVQALKNKDTIQVRKIKPGIKSVLVAGLSGYSIRKEKQRYTNIDPLLKGVEYNTAEGWVATLAGSYVATKNYKTFSFSPALRYGFANGHLNPYADVSFYHAYKNARAKWNKDYWLFGIGKKVLQYNDAMPITSFVNTVSTLLYGDNFMKTYEKALVKASYTKTFDKGLKFTFSSALEERSPLNNVTDWILISNNKKNLTPNYPVERMTAPSPKHNAFVIAFEASYKPAQRFIEFPDKKIAIGSSWPTFSLMYKKGIHKVLGSDVDFDKWSFSVYDDKNCKLWGLLKYKLSVGGFLNKSALYFQDYQHFNGNQSFWASEYMNSFQNASYYANSTNASVFYWGHIEHHFNGLLTNKIPGLRQWNWNLVAGTNTFYVNSDSKHIEFFVGLENILKVFRVDVVTAFKNANRPETIVRVGFGGLFSSMFNKTQNGGLSIEF